VVKIILGKIIKVNRARTLGNSCFSTEKNLIFADNLTKGQPQHLNNTPGNEEITVGMNAFNALCSVGPFY
jgi:hypothetical protein